MSQQKKKKKKKKINTAPKTYQGKQNIQTSDQTEHKTKQKAQANCQDKQKPQDTCQDKQKPQDTCQDDQKPKATYKKKNKYQADQDHPKAQTVSKKSQDRKDNFSAKKSFIDFRSITERFLYFSVLLMVLETIFHIWKFGGIDSHLPLILILCLPSGAVLSLLTSFFKDIVNKILTYVILGVLVLYYIIHVLYVAIFRCFFSIEYMQTSNVKIMQYYREIIADLKANWLVVALTILIPVGGTILLSKTKVLKWSKASLKRIYLNVAYLCVALCACAFVIFLGGKDLYSPYDLIMGENVPDFSFEKLGVLASNEAELKFKIMPKDETVDTFDVWVYEPDRPSGESASSGTGSGSAGTGSGSAGTGSSSSVGTGSSGSNSDLSNGQGNGQSGSSTGDALAGSNLTDGDSDSLNEIIEEIIDTSPNMLNIDFVAMSESETNSSVKSLDNYFASVEPSYKNAYTGMFEGYNLIFLTAEGFSSVAVDEEITPTLYKLVNEGFVFTNFYNPRTGGSTSDGEFVNCSSLYPVNGGATNFRICGENSMPFALGNMFNMKYGITSHAYHDNDYTYYSRDTSYPGYGYYYVGVGNGLKISNHWPESDLEMMEATIDDYIDDDLFHVYYMTVSGHLQYNFSGNYQSLVHKDEVADLPYSEACRAYLACQIELDKALEYLIGRLEEKGIADKTVICFTGDHWPYGLSNEEFSELLGHEVEENFELFKSNLILWSASIEEPIVIDKYCGSMDILPTLLNLFGFDYDSRLLMGRDILSDTAPFIMFINKSFITDKVMYNSQTGEITYLTDEELPQGYIDNCKTLLNNRWKYSQSIMDTDYYSYICKYLGIEIPVVSQNY